MTELLLRIDRRLELHLPLQHRPRLRHNPVIDVKNWIRRQMRSYFRVGTYDKLAKECLMIIYVTEIQHYFNLVSFHL